MFIFPLSYPILFGGINIRCLMNNPILTQVSNQGRKKKLPSIIHWNNLKCSLILVLNHFVKGLEHYGCFGFFLDKVDLTYIGMIIYKSKKPLCCWYVGRMWRTLNITMYEWKMFKLFVSLDRKISIIMFRQFTQFTLKISNLFILQNVQIWRTWMS